MKVIKIKVKYIPSIMKATYGYKWTGKKTVVTYGVQFDPVGYHDN